MSDYKDSECIICDTNCSRWARVCWSCWVIRCDYGRNEHFRSIMYSRQKCHLKQLKLPLKEASVI